MKKKVLLFLLASVLFVFIFAFCVNADYIYKTESGEEIFRFTMDKNNVIESYSGEGFAKTDGENALTWYVSTSTTD